MDITTYQIMSLSCFHEMDLENKNWKKRIFTQWEESKKYPRKKKKKVRKSLLLEWSIANWTPFEF